MHVLSGQAKVIFKNISLIEHWELSEKCVHPFVRLMIISLSSQRYFMNIINF